jgi:serine/threonine-protein kinase
LPEYPFDWPLPNHERLKKRARPEFIAILRKCLQVNPKKRFRDGNELLAAFAAIRNSALR